MCVNALSGLFSFLPGAYGLNQMPGSQMCQCPKRAFLISTNQSKNAVTPVHIVSMP